MAYSNLEDEDIESAKSSLDYVSGIIDDLESDLKDAKCILGRML